ncbi:putative C6 finger domain protein [Talaromyces proteolyticus]|uniref:C6 finger domain protein n=1 Tax=Talaromyces proteolyticus TaxID=1131652 RepID=A0AAD4PU70_9EURO|nr:putative C6 finger domain protein [Talaromyces proteolyticus]KAH8688968.1 putative C6 finger domain protein [Talaromyces proteolyticus]
MDSLKIDVAMSKGQPLKKARGGTKSCTECRRRKVRCIRQPEDAQTCRRCEERGSECVPQTYSSQLPHSQRLSSRYRISKLESKVASLSNIIRDIEIKLGNLPPQLSEATSALAVSSPEIYESDDNFSMSDVLATEPPSHICSLFQNDWLSVNTDRQNEQLHDREARASTQLLDTARHALQKLVPSKYEVSHITRSASRWLDLLHTLLPQPFAVKSHQEILECYEEMCKPDTNAISLATWLITIAITAQQVPQENDSPSIQLDGCQKYSRFSRVVSEIVESTLISYDRLICTVEGLGMAMHFVRLQMSQGNLQKAWLRLRHFIAVAELMGLPNACHAIQSSQCNTSDDYETQLQKAQLWQSLCSADGISGVVLNLPPSISPYQRPKPQTLAIDGVIQPRAYISRLIEITSKIQYRDNTNMTQGSSAELFASALELDRQLKVLASKTPKSWWARNVERVKPDHIVQFLHCCINMRIHLSFAMRKDPDEEYIYSRLTCRDACESVTEHYRFLRRELPSGIFISRCLDLQAFIATVILLLTSHSSPCTDLPNLPINKVKVDSIVTQVIEVMDEKSKNTAISHFAEHCINSLRSLKELLQEDDETSNMQELTLKIPLLGKVHIRRNSYRPRVQDTQSQPSFEIPANSGSWKPNEQLLTAQEHRYLPLNTNNHMPSNFQGLEEIPWDPLSWCIEDQYEDFFQDTLMADEIDQFA